MPHRHPGPGFRIPDRALPVRRNKSALHKLREREAMLLAAQRLANLASWCIDVPTGTLTWSAEAHRIFGMHPGELQALTVALFLERVHPEDRPQLQRLIEDACSKPLTASFGYRFLCPDGDVKLIRGSGESQVDTQGRVARVVGTLMDASRQEQLRREVQEKDARLRLLEESPDIWLWEQDAQLRFTVLSKGELDVLGNGALGKRRWEAGFSPACGSWDEHRRCLEERRPFRNFEFWVGHGPSARLISSTGVPFFAEDGSFAGYRGTAQDVTNAHRAEASAVQSRALLELAARLGQVGAWVLELPSMQVAWSSEFSRIYELGERELPSIQQLMSMVQDPWRPRLRALLRDCVVQGKPFDIEVKALTAKGRPLWLRIAAEAVRDMEGRISRVQGAVQDVTQPRQARDALAGSEERYRLLFEASGEAIIEADTSATIRRANAAACRLFRTTEDEMKGLACRQLVAPHDQRLERLVEERERFGKTSGSLTMLRRDGSSFEAQVTVATYRTSDRVLANMVVHDITDRVQYEQRLVGRNAELGESVRQRTAELEAANSELRGIAHALAHDLRSPIATVKAFAEMLERSLAAGHGKERHYAERIGAAAERMDDYVEALLSLARLSEATLRMVEVDISAMAEAVLDELHHRDSDRRVAVSVQAGLCVAGDARLLRVLLENLLGNAWKFTSRRQAAAISFSASPAADGRLVFAVRDNGAGFDMAWADRLFGNFQRLHQESEFPGQGIGLASVKRIVT